MTVDDAKRLDKRTCAPKMPGSVGAVSVAPAINPTAGVRFSTSNVIGTASSFIAAKAVYSAPGVMLIPQSMLPAGFDINHISVQREGRALSVLVKTANALVVLARLFPIFAPAAQRKRKRKKVELSEYDRTRNERPGFSTLPCARRSINLLRRLQAIRSAVRTRLL